MLACPPPADAAVGAMRRYKFVSSDGLAVMLMLTRRCKTATLALSPPAGVAAGATRAALTQHFACSGNAADVAAKEGSQVRHYPREAAYPRSYRVSETSVLTGRF